MWVLFDGTAARPLGRQLFAEQWPARDPKSIVRETLPKAASARTPDHRLNKFERHARDRERALKALAHCPRTAREMTHVLNLPFHRASMLLYRLAAKGVIVVVGERPLPHQFGRKVERIYGVPTAKVSQ